MDIIFPPHLLAGLTVASILCPMTTRPDLASTFMLFMVILVGWKEERMHTWNRIEILSIHSTEHSAFLNDNELDVEMISSWCLLYHVDELLLNQYSKTMFRFHLLRDGYLLWMLMWGNPFISLGTGCHIYPWLTATTVIGPALSFIKLVVSALLVHLIPLIDTRTEPTEIDVPTKALSGARKTTITGPPGSVQFSSVFIATI